MLATFSLYRKTPSQNGEDISHVQENYCVCRAATACLPLGDGGRLGTECPIHHLAKPGSPSCSANSRANVLISPIALFTIYIPGLPRSGSPTSDFVSSPRQFRSRMASGSFPNLLATTCRN